MPKCIRRAESVERLEPAGEVVGCDEVGKVGSQLAVAVVLEPIFSRVLNRPVNPLDLSVGARAVSLGQTMLDPVGFADHVEAHRKLLPQIHPSDDVQ